MSVLDVTRWDRQDASLVLGMYPLQFVSDVSQEIGAPFFATQSSRDIGFEAMRKTAEFFPRGSLLPFTLNAAQPVENKTVSKMDYGNEVHHPTVASWIIQEDGSVQISKAAILASTYDCDGAELECHVWLTCDDPFEADAKRNQFADHDSERFHTVDMGKWVRDYFPGSASFAVELCRSPLTGSDGFISRGLLLKEMAEGSRRLVKVGNYGTSNRYFPEGELPATPVREVDWIVL